MRKVPAVQARGPKFRPLGPTSQPDMVAHVYNPGVGEEGWAETHRSAELAGQPEEPMAVF